MQLHNPLAGQQQGLLAALQDHQLKQEPPCLIESLLLLARQQPAYHVALQVEPGSLTLSCKH